jgi:hypothetical protein
MAIYIRATVILTGACGQMMLRAWYGNLRMSPDF